MPQLVALTTKRRVRCNVHRDEQVARDSAAWRRGSATGESQSLTVVDTRGYVDVDRAHTRDPSLTATRGARVLDDRPEARTGWFADRVARVHETRADQRFAPRDQAGR